jgi:hypothetical protein
MGKRGFKPALFSPLQPGSYSPGILSRLTFRIESVIK